MFCSKLEWKHDDCSCPHAANNSWDKTSLKLQAIWGLCWNSETSVLFMLFLLFCSTNQRHACTQDKRSVIVTFQDKRCIIWIKCKGSDTFCRSCQERLLWDDANDVNNSVLPSHPLSGTYAVLRRNTMVCCHFVFHAAKLRFSVCSHLRFVLPLDRKPLLTRSRRSVWLQPTDSRIMRSCTGRVSGDVFQKAQLNVKHNIWEKPSNCAAEAGLRVLRWPYEGKGKAEFTFPFPLGENDPEAPLGVGSAWRRLRSGFPVWQDARRRGCSKPWHGQIRALSTQSPARTPSRWLYDATRNLWRDISHYIALAFVVM